MISNKLSELQNEIKNKDWSLTKDNVQEWGDMGTYDSCFSEPSENLTTNDFVTYNTLRLARRIYLSYSFDKRDGFSFPFQRNLKSSLTIAI